MPETKDSHCSFAKLDLNGKCRAYCIHNQLTEPGVYTDCVGNSSDDVHEFLRKLKQNRKFL